jgi:hypothetical protein
MAQILVTKPGVLNAADKNILRQAGVVTVEAAKPSEVRLLETTGQALSGDDMFFAAMSGVIQSEFSKKGFADAVHKLLASYRAA